MRTFWICLLISLALHVLFFPQVLGSLINSGEAEVQKKAPDRVQIRMVKKKKPPVEVKKPEPAVKKVQPKPKPKVEKPKLKPKPVVQPPKPVVQPPKPKPQPKPVAKPKPQPKPKPRPQPNYPKSQPKPSYPKSQPSYPKSKPSGPKSKPSQSDRRLNNKNGKKSPGGVRVPPSDQPTGGKTGLDPRGDWRKPSDPVGDPNGTGTEPVEAPPAPPAPKPAPPAPKPAPKPAPPAPKPAPEPKPAPPKPAPAPSARKEIISVPTIDPPAKFRREKLKGQLWVRFKIEADGSFTVSLFESSGNPEFDDFVLNEVRRTAQVQPAIGDDGKPKSSRPRRPVDINID